MNVIEELISWLKITTNSIKNGEIVIKIQCENGPQSIERSITSREELENIKEVK